MIYRILVDFGYRVVMIPAGVSPEERLDELHRRGVVPGEVMDRLRRFSRPDLAAVANSGGEVVLKLALWPRDSADKRMMGASFGALGTVMEEKGLAEPQVSNARARFYYTELGWRRVGRFVDARARQMGHVVKIIRRRNPPTSDVVYRDGYQMAVLPSRGGKGSEDRNRAR